MSAPPTCEHVAASQSLTANSKAAGSGLACNILLEAGGLLGGAEEVLDGPWLHQGSQMGGLG